jgi:hypothetical protein
MGRDVHPAKLRKLRNNLNNLRVLLWRETPAGGPFARDKHRGKTNPRHLE